MICRFGESRVIMVKLFLVLSLLVLFLADWSFYLSVITANFVAEVLPLLSSPVVLVGVRFIEKG